MKKKVLLIGCGHMGSALARSWIKSKQYTINIVDPIKYSSLKKKYKSSDIKIFNSTHKVRNYESFDFIIVATKPSDLIIVLENLSNYTFKPGVNFISVVAGKKINLFEKKLIKINNFFRIMPNLPATIGESMSCIFSKKKVSQKNQNEVRKLFSYSGKTIFLKEENQIDMATAISGSGPGFIFNTIDALEKAARKLGFSKDIAKILVYQTFQGSINLLLKNKLSAEGLVKTVATKGGTTEAGIKIMKNNGFHKIFHDLVKASYKRSKKISK